MSNALYQKYRPSKFSEIFGEEHIVNSLKNAIKLNQISHAYIFSGLRGIGKTTIAKILSKAVNCLNPQDGDACNECINCKKINSLQTMDIVEMDAASNNGVSEIRELIDTINYLPTDLKTKVYILDEVHMLTIGAWNALLKTLEECPKHVMFIFATTEFHKIPLTIVSRCQCFSFKYLPEQTLFNLISKVAKNENIKIDNSAIEKISNIAKGSARDAITFLDQIRSYPNEGTIRAADVDQIFGLIDDDKKIKFINYLANKDLDGAIGLVQEFEQSGVNLALLIQETFALLIEIYLIKSNLNYKDSKLLPKEFVNQIDIPANRVLKLAELWEDLNTKIKFNPNVKYNLELAIFKSMNVGETQQQVVTSTVIEKNVNHEDDQSKNDYIKQLIDSEMELKPATKSNISTKSSVEKVERTLSLNDAFEVNEVSFGNDNDVAPVEEKSIDSDDKQISSQNPLTENDNIPTLELPAQEEKTSTEVKKNNSSENENNFIKISFLSIANYADKDLKETDNKIFEDLKGITLFTANPMINKIINATKILMASKKGIVFLFDDEVEASFLNKVNFNPDFNKFISDTFKRPALAIGVTKAIAKELTSAYLKVRKLTPIADLDIQQINAAVKINKSTEEIALEYFGDDLKIDDAKGGK